MAFLLKNLFSEQARAQKNEDHVTVVTLCHMIFVLIRGEAGKSDPSDFHKIHVAEAYGVISRHGKVIAHPWGAGDSKPFLDQSFTRRRYNGPFYQQRSPNQSTCR